MHGGIDGGDTIGKYFPNRPEYAALSSLLNKYKPTHTFLPHNALHTNLQACVYAAFPSVFLVTLGLRRKGELNKTAM